MSAEPADQQNTSVDHRHHDRRDARDVHFRFDEHLIDVLRGLMEFVDLILFSHVSLDHTDGSDVFLYAVVEIIVSFKDLLEIFGRPAHDEEHDIGKQKYSRQIDAGQSGTDDKRHDHRDDHGGRCSHRHPQDHLKSVLNIGDIRRQSCHKARRGKLVNTGKRECLDVVVHGLSEISRKAGRRLGAEYTACYAEKQAHEGDDKHDQSGPDNVIHIGPADADIDDPSHEHRDDHLADDLSDHAHGREKSRRLEFTDVLK